MGLQWRLRPVCPTSVSSNSNMRRGARTLGLLLAVASSLPASCNAALSISSGYETFLMQIRRRIVCEEGDVFDEAEQRVAQPCDSMKDGPFCRGLPFSSAVPRHRPFTVDSIVPQHIFGDGEKPVVSGESSEETQSMPNKQATATLNQFLENYYNPREGLLRQLPVEGSMDFRSASPPWRETGFDLGFSRGLPEGIIATWEGAWQAIPVLNGPGPYGKATTVVRLNGVVGTIRFSRPVVLRHLLVRPPLHANDNPLPAVNDDGDALDISSFRLTVRARKAGREAWRSAYDFGSNSLSSVTPICGIGDLVAAIWPGDGRRYLAILLESHNTTATVRWLDDDHTHRLVPWSRIRTADGISCSGGNASNTDIRIMSEMEPPKRTNNRGQSLWRDLARRMKTIDEISFMVPFGAEGWLLGDLAIAAVQALSPDKANTDSDAAQRANDPSAYMVQVFPGPWALIVEVSGAAVMYNADDMLERGLRLRGMSGDATKRGGPAHPGQSSEDVPSTEYIVDNDDNVNQSAQLRVSTSRSVEGLRQLLRALADPGYGEPVVRLPPHVNKERFLMDAERLSVALVDASKAEVKKYGHFEAFFAVHWDYATPSDALQVVFERWRRAPVTQKEALGVFFRGQTWTGSYFCTQGPTQLTLSVKTVSHDDAGRASLSADLSFRLEARKSKSKEKEIVEGSYTVAGTVEAEGRALVLDPVPGSWKTKPKNFVMVGLQGIVSRSGQQGHVRYAGSIPIFGCDSFELTSKSLLDIPAPRPVAPALNPKSASSFAVAAERDRALWNSALAKLAESLTAAQKRWRRELQTLINEKGSSKKNVSTSQVQQLFEAARTAGLVSFELTTTDGEQFVVKIGR